MVPGTDRASGPAWSGLAVVRVDGGAAGLPAARAEAERRLVALRTDIATAAALPT